MQFKREIEMEKKIQQFFEVLAKAFIAGITLRPVFRALFSARGALYVAIAITVYYALMTVLRMFGASDWAGMMNIPREVSSVIHDAIRLIYNVIEIVIFIFLLKVLARHSRSEVEQSLNLALASGLLTEEEHKVKTLLWHKDDIVRKVSEIHAAGLLTDAAKATLVTTVEESYKRQIIRGALDQALKAGAIDSTTHSKRLNELG